MTASSASLPQRRRDALRQQLLDAQSMDDQLAIKRIERQWVHRYGVDSLLSLTSDEVVDEALVQPEPDPLDVGSVASAETSDAPRRLSRVPLVALSQVPLPPAPRLQRLRRWIPMAADELPRAS